MENKIRKMKYKKNKIKIKNSCNGSRGCRIYILPKDREIKKLVA